MSNFTDDQSRRVSANNGRNSSIHGGYKHPPKRRLRIGWLIVIDVLIAALIMLVFYITNYVIQSDISPQSLPTPFAVSSSATQVPAGTSPAGTKPPQASASTAQASWRTKFADKFTSGAVEKTANSYKSANINILINKVQKNGATYFLADIYIAELKYFKTAFAKKPDILGAHEATDTIAKENNAIIAINGDYCLDNDGPVVRNGKLYRDKKFADALVMNYDGTMQTYTADQLDMNKIKNEGAYQVWTFGPMLLKDGQPITQFNSTLTSANPRTAVGYYEPGHYCFLVVDGRQPGYSDGMSLKDMSALFYSIGCKAAFNLDGGQTSEMAFEGNLVNQPYNGGRSVSDILYIADE